MQKLNKIVVLLFFLLPALASGQRFSHSAKLAEVTESRFYSLMVEPEFSAYVHPSLKDLRIVDEKGNPVPYVVNSTLPNLSHHNFRLLSVVENSVKDSGRSHLILENASRYNIDGLALFIRNASVSRTAKVSGSDDGRSWFTIKENFNFAGGQFSDSSHFILTLDIPKSTYRYFRIVIDNLRNDPLNIVKAGTYSSDAYSRWLMQSSTLNMVAYVNPTPRFIQKDSTDGNSYIKVIQSKPYHVSAIRIEVTSPRFYRRNMQVITKNATHDYLLTAPGEYSLPRFAEKEFLVKIYNGDNPPLRVTRVNTSQEKTQVIAYLEAGRQYSILMGNPNAEMPEYDLEHFRDSISGVRTISLQSIQANIESVLPEKNNDNMSIWLIIIGVLGVLSFFTWNLTRELKKQKQ